MQIAHSPRQEPPKTVPFITKGTTIKIGTTTIKK